ncbi:mechanosensitive ion channel family protein [Desulfogranum japonicum]|uniref:mechanosensitive ion channel family protein n=1 Tax=Desulfogranum japonicum TaxID=231447 RepID=UPI00040B22B4|nr:mechanosensitive ion channel family protein [Desulfogranum japonicum]
MIQGGRLKHSVVLLLFVVQIFTSIDLASAQSLAESERVQALDFVQDQAQLDSVLATMDDQQVREVLRQELQQKLQPSQNHQVAEKNVFTYIQGLLHILQGVTFEDIEDGDGAAGFAAAMKRIPADVAAAFLQVGDGTVAGFALQLALIVAILVASCGVEYYFHRVTGNATLQFPEVKASDELGGGRLIAACLVLLPAVVHLLIFTLTAFCTFFLLGVEQSAVRMAFMACLLAIALGRGMSLIMRFLCAPDHPNLRMLAIDDHLAKSLYKGLRFLVWYLSVGLLLFTFLKELGGIRPGYQALLVLVGTLLIVFLGGGMVFCKDTVVRAIISEHGGGISWARRQMAQFWHILALLYLFVVWLVWINSVFSGEIRNNGALIISLLIVPIFLVIDRLGFWVIGNIVEALEIQPDQEEEEKKKKALGEDYRPPEERIDTIRRLLTQAVRLFIFFILAIWLLSLWGYPFPYGYAIVDAAFDILVTLALALFVWRFTSRFIERKIAESMPEEEDVPEDDGGEFGNVRNFGRSYTLLPLIRKMVAMSLMVMVTMIILSAIGIDIGPLLAGAGVIGLAVGFGAQKLVSDVFSGIFYLLDDAFRVGEYIEAGTVKGSVENITLRNVMLRHHRGMLQIVPHSELGSITNYMRGGIVVKFNLEFPYDTDVEKVRKIIKRVGQAMLLDEELGPDFILPVKSQGVYEITNSVMVIRVKFTAKPGRQFLIRREAFRRITEALAAKDIHYAHRKVIVEVPQNGQNQPSPDQIKQAVEAGAAAELIKQGGEQALEEDVHKLP